MLPGSRQLAKEAGIKPPDVLRNDLRVRVSHMRLQDGFDFDRSYLDHQIASYEEVVRSRPDCCAAKVNRPWRRKKPCSNALTSPWSCWLANIQLHNPGGSQIASLNPRLYLQKHADARRP